MVLLYGEKYFQEIIYLLIRDKLDKSFLNESIIDNFFKWLINLDLIIPPGLVIIPTWKDDPEFWAEILQLAIRRAIPSITKEQLSYWQSLFQEALQKMPPHVKIHNWGLVFYSLRETNHCFLHYLDNYQHSGNVNPFTGEHLRYPNTANHEGYGHGPFELTLLTGFWSLLRYYSQLFNLGENILSSSSYLSYLRASTIFGEAFAGYFSADPRAVLTSPDGKNFYPNAAAVLAAPYVDTLSVSPNPSKEQNLRRQQYILGYSAGPKFWLAIETSLFLLLWQENPYGQKLREMLSKIGDIETKNLPKLLRKFIFLIVLNAFNSLKFGKLDIPLSENQSISKAAEKLGINVICSTSELTTRLASLCLQEFLSQLQSLFGINLEIIEVHYRWLNSDSFDYLRVRLGVN